MKFKYLLLFFPLSAFAQTQVPDATISETGVTQHEAALNITESQIGDLLHTTDTSAATICTGSQVLEGSGACVSNAGGGGGGSGTVTSVAVSGSDGLEVDSGSPITTAGTIALGLNKTSTLTFLNVEDGATADQTQADIEGLGFVTGAHTIDTNTQLDQAGVEALGFVTGAHTIDTNTQLDQAGVEALGFVTGAHTIDTNTQLSDAQVATAATNEGFVTGAHTVDTNTQLDKAGVEALVIDVTEAQITDLTHTTDTNTTDHTLLSNIGTNTHAQVDTHIALTNEHIDWTVDQGATNIHSGNYTDNDTTYSVGDGGLTTNDFTNADHTKLNGIATGAEVNAAQVSAGEITAGTETAERSYSPADVVSLIDTHGGGDNYTRTTAPLGAGVATFSTNQAYWWMAGTASNGNAGTGANPSAPTPRIQEGVYSTILRVGEKITKVRVLLGVAGNATTNTDLDSWDVELYTQEITFDSQSSSAGTKTIVDEQNVSWTGSQYTAGWYEFDITDHAAVTSEQMVHLAIRGNRDPDAAFTSNPSYDLSYVVEIDTGG